MQNRHSFRLKGYDYSREGLYFITICCYKHDCYFGNTGLPPNNNKIVLNDCGKIAMKCWFEIPEHFSHVKLHEFVVMPNHIHGIIEILPNIQNNVLTNDVGAKNFSPLRDTAIPNKPKICGTSMTIGSIIRGYKIGVTKWFRENTQFQHVWQRNYFEHIIRDEKGYLKISEYIQNNPANWNTDKFYQYQL